MPPTSTLLLLAAFQVQVASVTVDPNSFELEVGATRQLNVQVQDGGGAPVRNASVRWFSRDPSVASVTLSGTVTAVSPGMVQILVVSGEARGIATVTVPELPPASIELALANGSVLAGASAPLEVVVTTRTETLLADPDVTFQTGNDNVATVDRSGRVYGRSPGTVRITATAGAASEFIDVRIVENPARDYRIVPDGAEMRTGDVIRFQVAAMSPRGERVTGISPEWTMSGPGAQIDTEDGQGIFVAERAGRYRITAMIGEETVRSTFVDITERVSTAGISTVGRGAVTENHSGDVWVFEGVDGRDYAYIGTLFYDWMKVWDVTDPTSPVLMDSMQLDARRINDVKIHPNNRVGVLTREGASNRRNGIVILDLSTPAHPTIVSEYTATVTGGVHNVWIEPNGLVYAAHNGTSNMHIIDISDPTNPREVGVWGIEKSASQKSLHDIIVQEGYAYLSYWDDGLVVLDVGAGTHGGTPTRPVRVSQLKYPIGNTHTAWRHGRYLFLGDEIYPPNWDPDRPIDTRGYVHVIDLDDIENPKEVGRYEVPEAGAHNLWVDGDRLFIGYYQAGLRVVDISGELRGDLYRQGREMAALKTTDENTMVPNWPMTWGAQVHKGHVFAWDLNSGLWVTKIQETVIIP